MPAATITITTTMTTILTPEQFRPTETTAPTAKSASAPVQHRQASTAAQALLRLLAWLSPAFPTGAFAYSHGLEWVIQAGDISNETNLCAWLTEIITHGTGRTDTIMLRHAHRVSENLAALTEIADLARATASCRERQNESLDQGRAFLLAAAPWGTPPVPARIPYPVAVGAVAGKHGMPEHATASAFLQAFTSNLISAAVRLVPLGQTAGLRVLAALEATILKVASETKAATLDDLGGCAFRSDLAAMRHETQYTRLFRS